MPWGVPTGRLNGMLDDPMQPQMPPPTLPIMGAEAPVAPITANGAIQHALKPGFFQQGGTGMRIAGILGDALAAAGGGQQVYAQSLLRKQQQGLEEAQYANRLRLQQEYEAKKPHFATDNEGNIVAINPADGTSRVVYHGTPKLSGLAAEIDQMERSGKFTPEEIAAYKSNHIDPIKMASTTDTGTGAVTLTPYRASAFGQPAAGPPRVLRALPPGAVPINDGGPTPAGSGTFPGPARVPRRKAD